MPFHWPCAPQDEGTRTKRTMGVTRSFTRRHQLHLHFAPEGRRQRPRLSCAPSLSRPLARGRGPGTLNVGTTVSSLYRGGDGGHSIRGLAQDYISEDDENGANGPGGGADGTGRPANSRGAGPADDRPLPPALERLRLQLLTASTRRGCPGIRRLARLPRKQQRRRRRLARSGGGARIWPEPQRKGTAQA